MSLFSVFDVSASAVSAQSERLNVVASNLANANSVAGPDGQPYKAREVGVPDAHVRLRSGGRGSAGRERRAEQHPGRTLHDPSNPAADASGNVTMPNVNPVEEMVNMISASRSYQSNVDVMTTAKTLLDKVIQMAG